MQLAEQTRPDQREVCVSTIIYILSRFGLCSKHSMEEDSPAVRIKEGIKRALNERRPWREMVGTGFDSFSRPRTVKEAAIRAKENIWHFKGNYAPILMMSSLYTLLSDPASMALLFMLALMWHYLFFFRVPQHLTFFRGRVTIPESAVLVTLCLVTVGSLLFSKVYVFLISSVQIGAVAVTLHAVFRDPFDLFVDEEAAVHAGIVDPRPRSPTTETSEISPV